MRSRIRCTALLLSAVLSLSSLPAQTTKLSNQDLQELAHYTLTMENITRFIQTLPDLIVLTRPDLRSTLNANPAYYGDLAKTDQRLAAHPEIVAIMARHGLTTHEFILIEMTWFSSTDAPAAQEARTRPKKLAEAHIYPANVAFREQHKAEIEALVTSTMSGTSNQKTAPELTPPH